MSISQNPLMKTQPRYFSLQHRDKQPASILGVNFNCSIQFLSSVCVFNMWKRYNKLMTATSV